MHTRRHVSYALSAALLLSAFFFFRHAGLLVDERAHIAQIHAFFEDPFTVSATVTQVPGYHYTLFALATITGWQTDAGLRFFSLLFGIGCVMLIWPLTTSVYRSLLFTFLPIIFPFFFLVYTDIASLFFVLFSLYLVRRHRHAAAGVAAIAACAMRQNNIVWLVFIGVYAYVTTCGLAFDGESRKWMKRNLWPFALGVMAFAIFLIWNHGNVSLGDITSHPTGSLHMGNVWFMLALFALLFLPFALLRAIETIRRFWRRPVFWAAAGCVFLFFLVSFTNTHRYNTGGGDYFIRNAVLIASTHDTASKSLFFIPVFIAIAALISTTLERPAQYLLYPTSVLFLLPSWLVEQRYYMIPFTLFLVFGGSFFSPADNRADGEAHGILGWTWIAFSVAASAALLILMARRTLFL